MSNIICCIMFTTSRYFNRNDFEETWRKFQSNHYIFRCAVPYLNIFSVVTPQFQFVHFPHLPSGQQHDLWLRWCTASEAQAARSLWQPGTTPMVWRADQRSPSSLYAARPASEPVSSSCACRWLITSAKPVGWLSWNLWCCLLSTEHRRTWCRCPSVLMTSVLYTLRKQQSA